ncbi:MAG: Phosphoenolpyruvate synthase, partial [Candidatus Berkelbacteria bacterium Licking1014_2]
MPYIKWFEEIGKKDLSEVGGKGANLGELIKAGLPVPNGFVVTAKAYFDFLKQAGLAAKIKTLVANLNPEDNKKLNQISQTIQTAILSGKMPDLIAKEVMAAYEKLGQGEVAVRSSATAEDLPEASFAGQQATFLNINGQNGVVRALQKCWASLFTSRAIYYRTINKFDHLKVGLASPVQKMVESEKSGVMFTINPVNNDHNHIVIEAGFGLGEAIVSGSITPDRYVVDKKSLRIVEREINQQEWEIVKNPVKTGEEMNIHRQLSPERAGTQKLT